MYHVGLAVDVNEENLSGYWRIIIGDTPNLFETVEEFKESVPDDALVYNFTAMGEPRDGFKMW